MASPPASPPRAPLVTLLVLSLALGGCTTLRPINTAGRATPVAVGDELTVTFADGRTATLTVDRILADGWAGHDAGGARAEVRRTDAARVERREHSMPRTAGLVLIIVFGSYLYFGLVVL